MSTETTTDAGIPRPGSPRSGAPGGGIPRPGVRPSGPWAFPVPEHFTLANGVHVQAFDIPGQYVLSLRLVIPVTLTSEPRDREGVATIMARTLDEGTSQCSGEEFIELLEREGVAFGAGMAERGLVIDVDVAAGRLDAALPLLVSAVEDPAFRPEDVARLVRMRLADIDYDRANGSSLAALEFVAEHYAPTDRAARPSAGGRDTVARIVTADVRAFHDAYVHPAGATLVIAGCFDGIAIRERLEATLGQWAGPVSGAERQTPAPPSHVPARVGETSIVLVDRPGSVQTDLHIGCEGPTRLAEEGWGAYQVLSFVVGGAPNARIDAVLREEKGYTYGIRASFRPRAEGGLFVVSGAVRREVTAPAVGLLLEILGKVRQGLTEEETRSGIDYISRTAPARYATADVIADEAAGLVLAEVGPDFVTQTLANMTELTPQRLVEAWSRWVHGAWTIVLVGDSTTYAAEIEALGLGPVRRVSA